MPYNSVWCLARDYFYKVGHWMGGPLGEIDRDKIPQEITDACQLLLRMEKIDFKERRQTGLVCSDLRKLYESFKPYLPLIIALRNPSLKMRHWENLKNLKNPPLYELESELHASINELIEKGAMTILEEINDISEIASREKKLEDAIQKMKDEWKFIKFELQEFRDSGTHVLKGAEPIWDMLDDHIMKTMTISSSPYIKFLQSEVNYWKYTLVKVQEILEEWTTTQRGWLYLWPIFSSDDIQRQLPLISSNFQTVDKHWRTIMTSTFQNPNVLDSCLQSRMHESLQQCNEMIERIQKGLNEYLHTKRLAFPRFFFLSNDDLLHILSQTKDPLRVQDHLNKCFEGIDKLHFQSNRIIGMYSSMGEYIEFPTPVEPFAVKELPFKRGEQPAPVIGGVRNIEEWLFEVEQQMKDSLRLNIVKASAEYSDDSKGVWILKWPSQVVLTLDQVQWTENVEVKGIKRINNDPQALKKVYQKEEAKLRQLVEIIKIPRTNQAHLMTLGALIVLDVHSKDVSKDLAFKGVNDLAAFDWICQFRYYVIKEATKSGAIHDIDISVKMVNTTRQYGFEYLGNQPRLVITPLTDRCYRTLMGALQLNLGGAPEGPAGTGKTETTKDLAKAVAKQCIVFNCSDQLNVESMAKFFKGLACCGAWACFDEFNRIELEVLSVIAQQILMIQTALMRRRPHTPFFFDDEQIPMNPTCAVFITMNPGYAGRSELPDNLKALFRPVAMMIPNYAMIAEISLYSFGFQNARELSVKITQSLRLASEQLSTQSHYDYGMRAVKSIILAAGSLKRDYPNEEEARLALRAISDCNIPKFLTDDIPLFEGIISDLFPTTNKAKPDYETLLKSVREVIELRNLDYSKEFETKTIQLYETVQVRHGLMMVGSIMSGKTQIVHTLSQGLTLLNRQTKGIPDKVKISTINPKSVTIGQLYGDFDKISHDWSDGVLAAVIKDCATDKSGDLRWILMDGPVDAVWIENLNTVLDDNKKLCLSSGEIVKFTPKMTMMFEVEDLLEASPATVSRCGMVYLNPEKLGWKVQVLPWIKKLPLILSSDGRPDLFRKLIGYFIPITLGYIFGHEQTLEEEIRLESLKPIIQVTNNQVFRSFLVLFESLLLGTETRQLLEKKDEELKDRLDAKLAYERLQQGLITQQSTVTKVQPVQPIPLKNIDSQEVTSILNIFLMSMTWSFGASLQTQGRSMFSQFISEQLQTFIRQQPELKIIQHSLLNNGDYYSHFYNTATSSWLRWDHSLDSFKVKPIQEGVIIEVVVEEIEFQSIFIPTEDTVRYSHLLNLLTLHSFPVLFIGDTGTGKTSMIKKFQNQLSKQEWELGQMVFSATSTSQQVQTYIQSIVEKQRKGVYGPKVPGHKLLIFIDDLNMPVKEQYGAQPPIEMLRQIIDNGGFYELKTNELLKMVNLVFVGAMGIPGGGRTLPTKRLLRHFNLLHMPPFSSDNLFRIFSKILDWGFASHPKCWQSHIATVTQLTISLFENAVQVLLPLPSKSHYLFNLRQVSELVQGLTLMSADAVNKSCTDDKSKIDKLQKLWVHESMRVFSDRLINEEDRQLFYEVLVKTVIESRGTKPMFISTQNLQLADSIIFNNFIVFNPLDSTYQEAQSLREIESSLYSIIDYYNEMNKDKLSLLIFDYMLQHLSRVSRILYKPYGHGLLIGLGGNGRRTLANLAAFINDCTTFKVDIGKSYSRFDWNDDLKGMYKTLGVDNKKVVFTFSDSEIKADYFIEDISNMLNVGEVPGLYTQEEKDEIIFEMQKTISKRKLIGAVESQMQEIFSKRTKKNFHLLLFMSPAGPQMRQYIRQYPALVNCTSIDWYLSWPEEALSKVSLSYLGKQSIIFPVLVPRLILDSEQETVEEPLTPNQIIQNRETQELLTRVSNVFVQSHKAVIKLSEVYLVERGRQVYITPTRFTENFALFQTILLRKTKQIDEERSTYLMGTQKLDEANLLVDGMKAQLEELKPVLDQKTKQVEQIMINLDREAKEVEAVKIIIDQEAQSVYEQKEIAEGIKNECEARLSEAQPLLDEALKALRTLKVNDFVLMKSFNSPPVPIKLALEAACIMLGIAPKYIEGPVSQKTKRATKIPDYWEKSKKLLNDYKKFLSSLENYNKDNIPEERMAKIADYLHNPKFVPEEIRKASEAAEGICKWVIAICKYDIIAKEIRPKKEALGWAQEKLNVVMAKLKLKEAELQKIIETKNKLEEEFKNQNMEKQSLIHQRDECQAKLGRASILIGSLGMEKERWTKASERLLREKHSLLGDTIFATLFITYLGAFECSFRERLTRQDCRVLIQQQGDLAVSDDFNLQATIGVPLSMQFWQLRGLPQDSVSVENMIVMEETKDKWPLLIDPQGYALKFLKDYLEQDFISIKLQSDKYSRKLETALFQGGTVICEGLTEKIDQSLNSILYKDIQEVKGLRFIKFNDQEIEYNDKFRLFIITIQANPHFSPDIHTRTRLLNFSVTREGLEQQLLSVVCRHESARDEDEKDRLLRQNIEFQDQKRIIEEQILEQLRNSGADILEEDTLVNSLNESKKITDDIKHKLHSAKMLEERIEENRKNFKPVAMQAAKMYFALQEMSQLDPMYQFSMRWFRELFVKSFTQGEKTKEIKGRVKQLKQDFLKVFYTNVCRSLFEKHKLMFAFSMSIKLHLDDGTSNDEKRDLFNKKLKELEQMHSLEHQMITLKPSINGNNLAPPKQISLSKISYAKRSLIDKKSDTTSQTGALQQQINQHNEEERLRIQKDELHYLLTGLVAPEAEVEERPNPCDFFISNKTWQQICELATLDHFENLPDDIEKNSIQWKKFIQRTNDPVPEPYLQQLPEFVQIILHKVLKPEKTVQMIQKYVQKALGHYFTKPIIHSLEEIFEESKVHIPIILILTPGNDPMEQIKKFGEEKQRVPHPVSLGKGQGEKAKVLINETRKYGGWVILQNCHLAQSFLPEIEQIIDSLNPANFLSGNNKVTTKEQETKAPHPDFRLWLTSMSTTTFPFSILQDSIKVTSEPPKGLKNTLVRIFNQIEQSKVEREFFNANTKQSQWKRLFLALSFFHGIVRERRRYGSLGWNLNYDFNDSDFRISMRQLHHMIDNFEHVPFTALSYLTGECNYGGRVTDDWDRRTLITILKDFYCEKSLLEQKYHFAGNQKDYFILPEGEFDQYVEYVMNLPDEETPQLVGLHPNASITQAINDSSAILGDILRVSSGNQSQSSSSSIGGSNVLKMAQEIFQLIPDPFKVKEVEKKFPFKYEESMNSVLLQELARFNTLTIVIKSSLVTMTKTLEGKLVMNVEIERLVSSILNNNIPEQWRARSYPSKKPLLSYVKDLSSRLKMLQEWIEKGQPHMFWISGFFFTQSFLTGVKQNFARKYKHPIDKVSFTFKVLKYESQISQAPDNGCIAHGLYLEGANWNNKTQKLQESEPKILFVLMPSIHFLPILEEPIEVSKYVNKLLEMFENNSSQQQLFYECPVYKTSARAGTLSTTGHSTNYILTALLPTTESSEDIWIKRSVAMLSQLDD